MIKRELVIFLAVGFITVVIDFALYRGLIYLSLSNLNVAKGLGFIGGTIFAYFANRLWTFKEQSVRPGSVRRFILVYILGLSANILVNYICITILGSLITLVGAKNMIYIAFLLATSISAALNFLGMKFFVFTSRFSIQS
jgi:putative flippase GtrA